MRYLLDTNIVSNPAHLTPSAKVTTKLRAHHGQMAIASVTWQELVYGMKRLTQIAAVAATQGMVLVTNNTRHFEVFTGLTIEDWMA